MAQLGTSFDAVVQKSPSKAGWTYVVWEESAAFFKTRGLVKVRASVDGFPFESSFMAIGGGRHKLPLKGDLLARLGKQTGDSVTIRLGERLN